MNQRPGWRRIGRWLLFVLCSLGALLAPGDYLPAGLIGCAAVAAAGILSDPRRPLNYLFLAPPYLLAVLPFLLSPRVPTGDCFLYHFPAFDYIARAAAAGHPFPNWLPLNGGIKLGIFHINCFPALPQKMLGYASCALLGLGTLAAYKLQYAAGTLLMGGGWWLALRRLTGSRLAAGAGTIMVILGGTAVTFHQEQALATAHLLPWFLLSLLLAESDRRGFWAAAAIFGLGFSTHYPQIQAIALGLAALAAGALRPALRRSARRVFRAPARALFLPPLLIPGLLPALYLFFHAGGLASELRGGAGIAAGRTYESYLALHRRAGASSATPRYFRQYLLPRFSADPDDPLPQDEFDRASFFVGRIGILLAAAGLVLAFRRTGPVALLAVLFAALALGINGPLPRLLFAARFPMIGAFRQWVHFFPFLNFSLSLLAAFGFQRLVDLLSARRGGTAALQLLFALLTAECALYARETVRALPEEGPPLLFSAETFFSRRPVAQASVFQYRDRAALEASCPERAIPARLLLTDRTAAVTGSEPEEVCAAIARGGDLVVEAGTETELPPGGGLSRPVEGRLDFGGLAAEVDAPAAALLLSPANRELGIAVSIDGRPAEAIRANSALTAVAVPPGRHRVRFSVRFDAYWPLVWVEWLAYLALAVYFFRAAGRCPPRDST